MAGEDVPCAPRPGTGGERVLITGATGLLGRQVLAHFQERGWNVRGLGRSRAKGKIIKCDLLNPAELQAQFEEFQPTIVIHCAAERRPDVLEEDMDYAMHINVDLTRQIGKACHEHGVWLIYISTNYVFDGKEAPYREDAQPNPLNTYGDSKLAGERALVSVHPGAAILRVPLLLGPIEYIGETSVTALLDAIQKEKPKLDNWQERFPTGTPDLARVLEAFCGVYMERGKVSASSCSGIFHWQANARHTKYTMACIIAELVGIDPGGFVRVDDAPAAGSAPRPQFERMLCGRLEALLSEAGEGSPDSFRSDFQELLRHSLQPFLEKEKRSTIEVETKASACSSSSLLCHSC